MFRIEVKSVSKTVKIIVHGPNGGYFSVQGLKTRPKGLIDKLFRNRYFIGKDVLLDKVYLNIDETSFYQLKRKLAHLILISK